MHPGQGPGLSLHDLGETGGSETVTLLESEIPSHAHALRANTDIADVQNPSSQRSIARSQNANAYKPPGGQPRVDDVRPGRWHRPAGTSRTTTCSPT